MRAASSLYIPLHSIIKNYLQEDEPKFIINLKSNEMYALPNKTQHKLIASKPCSSSPFSPFARHDEASFKCELGCLPQPVFQHSKSKYYVNKLQKQCITPEHNEMIKFVQQSWKGVEPDYKKSVNNFINNIDINDHHHNQGCKQKQGAKKKTATTSTPLLLTGPYHHTTSAKDLSGTSRQDPFRPFDLEAFWRNRILKRLTQDTL